MITKLTIGISIILGVIFGSGAVYANVIQANACKDMAFDISKLKPEELRIVDFPYNHKVIIYRRTKRQIQNVMNSEPNGYENILPSWWELDRSLVDRITAINKTRSKLKDFFVFWPYSPNGGYFLSYIGEANVGKIGGKHWYGGFLDPVTGAAYDTAGRFRTLEVVNEAGETVNSMSNASLVIPKHNLGEDGKVLILQCE